MRWLANLSPPGVSLALVLATTACSYEEVGLPTGGSSPVVRTGSAGLPRAGAKSIAVWMSSGGGRAAADTAALSVSLAFCPVPATVAASSGGQVTVGHFVDTLE
jgi:hypothetical protein